MSQDAAPSPEGLQDDPFEVLGLPKDASDDDIKSAHRKLALKCGIALSVFALACCPQGSIPRA